MNADALGGSQGKDLHDRDGDIGIGDAGLVTPPALAVLGVDDEIDGAFEAIADAAILHHAVGFRQ